MRYTPPQSSSWIADCLPPSLCAPDVLGASLEAMMGARSRRTQGSHFTPRIVADKVAGLAISELDLGQTESPPHIWDPAAGGGAFLLSAAREVERRTGRPRSDIVRLLHASDIDPMAVAVCDASLELWARGQGRIETSCGDALLDREPSWPDAFELVIGNPPFLGQLSRDTSRVGSRRARIRARFAEVASGYVDEAGLFLHLALSRTGPEGVVALILPESLLAARDATSLRVACERNATLTTLWIDDGQSFEAAVDVVAPIFVRRPPAQSEGVSVLVGESPEIGLPRPADASWSALLAGARGVPPVHLDLSTGAIADVATATAGFRQHFYGIADAVRESPTDLDAHGPQDDVMQLVTSGTIDPLRSGWGVGQVKFAGTSWHAPELHLRDIPDDAVRRWFMERRQPKLLLATQTRVLEVVVDVSGSMAPSVPVIAVEPRQQGALWLLAAVLSSPAASAWMAARAAGTGLSHRAIRVRAKELAQIPLPSDEVSWREGADAAEAAHRASQMDDGAGYLEAMRVLARTMSAAYGGVDDVVSRWWWEGLRMPAGFTTEAY